MMTTPPTRQPAAGRHALSRLEVDLSRLEANLLALRQALGGTPADSHARLCAVLKKNAYGLGAVAIAARLVRVGCDMLAVYSPDEAEHLIRQAVDAPLLMLMPVRHIARTDLLYRHAVAGKLHLTIHDPGQLDAINQVGRAFGMRMPVHLLLDTGMSRGGLNERDLQQTIERLHAATHVHLVGLYTHPATADTDIDYAREQLDRFEQALATLEPDVRNSATLHIANTFATLRDRAFHLDMVRVGLGLLGYGPELLEGDTQLDDMPALQPIIRWVSRVIHVQRYPADSLVGYGISHRLKRDSTLGVVPVGYGDGYPLALGNRAVVRVRPADHDAADHDTPADGRGWTEAPVVGRVNMDQLVIDLTDAPSPDALMDGEVELVSDDPDAPNALPKLAALADSHCYELLCRLGASLPRQYRQ